MSVTSNIVQTYVRPRKVMARMLAAGQREDRAIAILAGGCLMLFLAQWPRRAREAAVSDDSLLQLLTYDLFGTLFLLPLLMYALGALGHIIAKIFGGKGTWYGARLALFWSLLATAPILVLWGMTLGFLGEGLQSYLVGLVWFIVFLVFWTVTLREAERG
ncbi:MAG: YIP1 family protein [Shimia sp.]